MQTHNGWSSDIKQIEAVQSRSVRLVENGWERTCVVNVLNNQIWPPIQSIARLLKPEWNSFENPFFPCTRGVCLGPIPIPDNNSLLSVLPTPLPLPLTSWSGSAIEVKVKTPLFKEALMLLFIVMRICFCFKSPLNRIFFPFFFLSFLFILLFIFLSFFLCYFYSHLSF